MPQWHGIRSKRLSLDVRHTEPWQAIENAERALRALERLPLGIAAEYTADELVSRALTTIGDIPIPTASLEYLIASKRTGRLQELADIQVLEELLRLRGQ